MRKEENDQDDDIDGPVIDESLLTAKELLGLQQAEERLQRDCIYRLRKVAISANCFRILLKMCIEIAKRISGILLPLVFKHA